MNKSLLVAMLAIVVAVALGQVAHAECVTANLALYLDAADVDGAGTAAADATGTAWKDLSGATEHDGALGGTEWGVAGVGDGTVANPFAMRLDGTDDIVSFSPVFSLDEMNVTLEFWVNVSSVIDTEEGRPHRSYVYSEGSVSSRHKNSVYFIKEDSWAPHAVEYDQYTPGGTQVSKSYYCEPGKWMQVVVTKSGSDAVLYKNGAVEGTFSDVETYTGGEIKYTTVGAEINDYAARHFFVGDIGIVRLYNAALTGEEVLQNYNNDAGTFVPEPHSLVLIGFGLLSLLLIRRRRI